MSDGTVAAVDASAAAIGAKFSFGGGATGAASFWFGVNWLGWLGVGIAIAGLIVNWYFSYQRNKRELAEHKVKMKQLNQECNIEEQK
jgi:hypothetical protein